MGLIRKFLLSMLLVALCSECRPAEGLVRGKNTVPQESKYIRSLFCDYPSLGLVQSMRFVPAQNAGGAKLVVAGANRAAVLSGEGQLETSIEYATDEKPWFISVIHGARQEEILFLGVLPEDAQRGVLFRFDGSVATVFPAGYYARAVSGDVNGDGRLEVVISSKQDGPRIFDLGGNEMGRIRLPYMTSHFYLVDIDGDKAEEIIAQTAEDRGRRIRIVKGNGTNVGAWSLLFRFYDFAVARWPGENDLRLLFLNGDTVAVLDCEGKQCMSLNAPRGSRTVRISACTVVGGEDGLKLVCVTSGRVGGPHIVFVWSQDGELEYRQMAVDSADSVMEIPEPGGRSVGGFLVGSEGKIWKYAPRGSQ